LRGLPSIATITPSLGLLAHFSEFDGGLFCAEGEALGLVALETIEESATNKKLVWEVARDVAVLESLGECDVEIVGKRPHALDHRVGGLTAR
jgi:hypothetical protein